jgi:GTPase
LEPRRRDTRADALTSRPEGSGRALVIEPHLRSRGGAKVDERAPSARLEEAVGLARAIDLDVVQSGIVTLSELRPATYIGKGKV